MTGTTITRRQPWHVMGEALRTLADTEITSVPDALALTGLDYDIEVWEVEATKRGESRVTDQRIETKAHRATVRTFPNGTSDIMGIVGTRYTVVQNRDAFAFTQYLVDEFGCRFDAAADYAKGAKSLLVLDLQRPVVLDPSGANDRLDLYLAVTNSHDGSGALRVMLSPVRWYCTNVERAALRDAKQVWSFSHTPNVAKRLHQAEVSIRHAVAYADSFALAAERLLDTPMSDRQFVSYLDRLVPVPREATERVTENREQERATLKTLFHGEANANIAGTAWAAYNAVTEFVDHYRPTRGEADIARAEGALDGPYTRMKDRAYALLAK